MASQNKGHPSPKAWRHRLHRPALERKLPRELHHAQVRGLRASAALITGICVALIGLFVPSFHSLYDDSWLIGFFLAASVYYALMIFFPQAVIATGTSPTSVELA